MAELNGSEIALIGMALRFPGANSPEQFWDNLKNGVESIRFFTDEELLAAGVPAAQLSRPNYVKARPMIEGIDLFDADLFGIPSREARFIDPQHRLFLECSWEALERAGCNSESYPGLVGVYAGCDLNSYLLSYFTNAQAVAEAAPMQIEVASDKEYLASRVSYKLDLQGPSVVVQSACSTSLVAVHMACQALLSGECDMALAGGSSVRVPQVGGYSSLEGGVHSPDGHCRPFDAHARGTVFGSGVGVVVIKRLADALANGDIVHAVIKGSGMNNDGARKIGYTAPGGDGQTRVVRAAQLVAEVSPETITYVEAHGTATPLGDPIEVAALTQAFRAGTERKGFCAIGSVKGNIGHLKTAAGVAGLIKTVLCLEHRELPPSLHLERPSPHIDFANSPFFVNDRLRAWEPAAGEPLRAAVSSFGVGGTNAHIILEEASPPETGEPSTAARPWQLLPLSANTPTALDRVRANLADHLRHSSAPLPDIAWTLQVGRRAGRHRAFVTAHSHEEAIAALEAPERVQRAFQEMRDRPVAFLFPGQGAQHPDMGRDLYETEPAFRESLDRCCEALRPLLGLDLRQVMYPQPGAAGEAARRLEQTALAQPALFAVEHALARLWMSWGIRPQAMLGHSLGEYVAACLAGVFSLEDALALVAERGRLMQSLPPGAMLSVPLSEDELLPLLGSGLALAAVNGPSRCVVSGSEDAVAALEAGLGARGTAGRRLHTSHAFHSVMMEPILAPFAERVRAVRREPPRIPFVSNLTGTWITADQATDPGYWSRHLRQAVRFGDGLGTLASDGKAALLEVGPGQTLSTLARQVPGVSRPVSSLPQARDGRSAAEHLTEAVGRLWLAGVAMDWPAYHAGEDRRRVELPTYPFERKRYWIEGGPPAAAAPRPAGRRELQDWFQVPCWKPSIPPEVPATVSGRWLVFADAAGLGEALSRRITERGGDVVLVKPGDAFEERGGYTELFARLRGQGKMPDRVLHLWGVGKTAGEDRCFWSLLWLAQELGRQGLASVQVRAVTDGLQSVAGEPVLAPEKATALGPVRVLPLEHPGIGCAAIDVVLPADEAGRERLADLLLAEAAGSAAERVVAYRGEERWIEAFEPVRLPAADPGRLPLRERGVYLITGGLGGVGMTLARELARSFRARLVLTGRTLRDGSLAAAHELEELGAEVLVLAADVTDEAAMREVVRRARERFGPIQGAIHAAGVPGGGVIQLKTIEAASRVLAPKVRGAQVLARVLAGEPVELLVLLASTFGITGGVGQVDYCAANSFLDAFARQVAQRGLRAISLDWAAWQEVGMAAEAAALRAAGEPRPSRALPGTSAVEPAGPGDGAPFHPLLDRRLESAVEAEAVYATDFSPARHWVLAEHRILGTPALPGTAWLEMARAAFACETGAREAELQDVTFVSPLLVADGDRREARIVLEWDGGGEAAFHGISRASTGGEWQEHAHGRVRSLNRERPSPQDAAALAARCVREVAPEGRAAEPGRTDRLVSWGPRWQSLRRASLGDGEGLLELELPADLAADLDGLALHPALLDVATGAGGGFLAGGNALPESYRRLAVLGPLPARVLAHVRVNGVNPAAETVTMDLTLLDEEGGVRVEIEGFSMKRLGKKSGDAVAPASERAGWIRPDEGVEAFRRALSRGRFAQIAISPTELGAALAPPVRQEREEAPGRPAGEAFPRPSLTTPYVAPRDTAEQAMAELWQRVLKIDKIGVHDNFFDLGGDSVVAIQLVAQATASGLALTTQEVFEKQTVAALARLAIPYDPGAAVVAEPAEPAPAGGNFSVAGLSQSSLERLLARLGDAAANVEDLYRLSPIQEGMLFHALHGGEEAPYFEQLVLTYDRDLDLDRLERAWRQAVERHPVLRTSFVWEDVETPVQIVHRRVELPFGRQDWQILAPPERDERLRRFLAEDRSLGFALDRAPLLRLNAIWWSDASWRLAWSYHHLLLDGWSVGLLLREVAAIYNAGGQAAAAALEPRRPFRDYITWLRQQDLSAAEAWWQRTFEGFFAPTALGIDRTPGRPVLPGDVHAEVAAVLPAALTASLEDFARRHRLTLHTVIEGAWALALARYGDTEDVVFGSTLSGRPAALPGSESMIGCFINTLPVRARTALEQKLLPWLQNLQACQVELRRFEHSPLVEVRRWSGLPGDRPLFETILVFESLFGPGLRSSHAGGRKGRQLHQRTNFPLTLVVWPGREIALEARFYTGRFAAEDVSRLLGYVTELLAAIVTEPDGLHPGDRRLADLPLLLPHEHAQILREWNDTAEEIPAAPVHHLFAARATCVPEAPAVADAGRSLTCGELDARANRLAHHLIRLGVGPEVLVGVSLERSADMVVALLGILKAGGAYLPLDPAYPVDRLRLMLEDSGTRFLLAADGTETLAAPGLCVVHLDDPAIAGEPARPPRPPDAEVEAPHLAYVLYTSGSTGRPKGVQVTHGALANFLAAMRRRPGLEPGDVLLTTTSLSFDIAALEIYLPLLAGARIVVARREEVYDGRRLRELLAEHEVTVMQATPSTWRMLVDSGWRGGSRFRVLCGGEALPEDLAAALRARAAEVWNLYGPTETTVWSAVELLPPDRPVSIGRPIANTGIYVLGSGALPVPAGAPGELLIGGAGVARGYLGRPDLTAERFVPDPFAGAAGVGGRLYRTGDLARHRADGRLELLGRIDQQVKVRGFRIELGEIEAALSLHSTVAQAAVVARDDWGDRRLVAYVTPSGVREPVPAELREFLRARLPEYMQPAAFVVLPALPLTPNLKVDRRALPAPANTSVMADAFVAPRSPLEEVLAEIWAEVLRLEKVGIDDDFFALGGHSLLAFQVVSRIQRKLGLAPPVHWIFERPTVRGLAERTGTALSELPALRPTGLREGEPVPASFAQEGLWLLDRLAPGSAAYNLPLSLRLGGRLDAAALTASLHEIVRRHAVLRTRFAAVDDVPHQIVGPVPDLLLPVIDLSGLPERVRDAEARRLAVVAVLHPFDLTRGPLLRAVLLRLGAQDHAALLAVHHIASDGWSTGVLLREVALLYEAFSQGRPSPLTELPVQYADYAAWQRQWLRGEVLSAHLDYWRRQLAGAPAVLPLRTDRPRPAVRTSRGGRIAVELPAELRDRLVELGRTEHCTLFMTLLAGYSALLHQWAEGTERVVVGSPISYRNWPEVEDLIGFFANVLVYHTRLEGDPTFRELLSHVRRMVLDGLTHQHVSFERLVEELRPERSLSHNPLFQVMFAFTAAGAVTAPPPDRAGLVVDPFGFEGTTAQFDLELSLTDAPQGVIGTLTFSRDLFEKETVAWRWDQLRFLLEEVAREPDLHLSELRSRLTEVERRLWARRQEELEEASSRSFKDRRRRMVMAVAEVIGGAVQEG